LHGQGTVAKQPLGPIFTGYAQGFADQQTSKTRAVDEEVTFDQRAIGQAQRSDVV
jgi:hypothetical protein